MYRQFTLSCAQMMVVDQESESRKASPLHVTLVLPLHYRLSSIKGVQFANFASHFIRIQIFQIDFRIILSAPKYFRYISLLFYICRGQNEHFSFNSERKRGRVEPF